ncbi:DUF397 domain-containing protein [Streptomyces sp. NPDC052236]|uniref:DUF397 domain-containing protein n=1 Tax=Streptomyces sp. NPDC052236 TaxID=3365686 RepID=UPI0037D58A81
MESEWGWRRRVELRPARLADRVAVSARAHAGPPLLNLYGVTDEARIESFIAMARQGRQSGWWERHADGLRPSYTDFIALEAEATEIRSYQPLLIPGLLQTPDYARAIISAHPTVTTETELTRRVEVRANRQQLLTDGRGVRFWAIIGGGALRSSVGGERTMCEQLRHLLDVAELPNVNIQVLPCDVGEHHGGNGPFVVVTFPLPEESHIVCEEGLLTSVYLDSTDEVKAYAEAFNALRSAALSPRKSRDAATAGGWRKSSYSGGEGDCVEVADLAAGAVWVRDSKRASGPALMISGASWGAFVAGVRRGLSES